MTDLGELLGKAKGNYVEVEPGIVVYAKYTYAMRELVTVDGEQGELVKYLIGENEWSWYPLNKNSKVLDY